MRYLHGHEERAALDYLLVAQQVAKSATCTRSRCGSVIVKDDTLIGTGYNSPPAGLESQRRCGCAKQDYHQKVTDRTCCVHAEQRAMLNAVGQYPAQVLGSRLYFVRLVTSGLRAVGHEGTIPGDDDVARSGRPYCTICSKMALDVGIAEFVLWHKDGICAYGTEEYNDLSYKFSG